MPRMTHLLPDDKLLMEEYLLYITTPYDKIDYDIRVGCGRPCPDQPDPKIRSMAMDLSQRRIDAVCHRSDHIDILEVTMHAGIKALGQLIAYPKLYHETFPNTPYLKPVLVCRSISPDMVDIYASFKIAVYIFPSTPTE